MMTGTDAPRRLIGGLLEHLRGPAAVVGASAPALHGARVALDPETQLRLLQSAAFVPARLWRLVAPEAIAARLGAALREAPQAGQAAAFWLGEGAAPWSVVTYAGLHVGWAHAISNGILIALCGAPVARRLSAPRFVAFVTMGAAMGAAAQMGAFDAAFAPLVGASASVCALIGALARLWTSPPGLAQSELAPLAVALRRVESWAAFAAGGVAIAASAALGEDLGAIGWRAHLGGFVAGFLTIGAFAGRRKMERA